jgi:hypothetical protein
MTMEPLDLRLTPPRAPRAEAAGLIFLPRTIDKARAALPGGDLGPYRTAGFSERMLETIGIDHAAFAAEVARASDEADVVAFVAEHAKPEGIAEWNAFVLAREPAGGDRARALEVYPFLRERDDLTLALDVLAEDDRRMYELH